VNDLSLLPHLTANTKHFPGVWPIQLTIETTISSRVLTLELITNAHHHPDSLTTIKMSPKTSICGPDTPCTPCNQPSHYWSACQSDCPFCVRQHLGHPCPAFLKQHPEFDLRAAQVEVIASFEASVDALEQEATAKEAELKHLDAALEKIRNATGLEYGPFRPAAGPFPGELHEEGEAQAAEKF
jgi:hypothetical protein